MRDEIALQNLLAELREPEIRGDAAVPVTGIAYDSRRVEPGNLFVCLKGLTVDGHGFAADTVRKGAGSLVVERWLPEDVPQVKVADSREAMARLSSAFYRHPWNDLAMAGVTGTNGKTTVTHFLEGIGRAAGRETTVLGTLGTTGFTTPEAPRLQALLREAADQGAAWVAMECSSHALNQKRLLGTRFDVVVFTNLSRDHLDYHHTMEAYFQAKARLFDAEYRKPGGTAVIAVDDAPGRRLWESAPGPKVSYGLSAEAEVRATDLDLGAEGTAYTLRAGGEAVSVTLRIPGRYNVLNALAAQAAALRLGAGLEQAARGVEAVSEIPGRMHKVAAGAPVHVYVDYAHTPDGLRFALEALRELTSGALWVVFGCGGDRDPGKRPLMGEAAERGADKIVITSDNPRSEPPERIIQEVLRGFKSPREAHAEPDRRAAIAWALAHAQPGDTILIAGKGHETRQVFGDASVEFDDRAVAEALMKEQYGGSH